MASITKPFAALRRSAFPVDEQTTNRVTTLRACPRWGGFDMFNKLTHVMLRKCVSRCPRTCDPTHAFLFGQNDRSNPINTNVAHNSRRRGALFADSDRAGAFLATTLHTHSHTHKHTKALLRLPDMTPLLRECNSGFVISWKYRNIFRETRNSR